MEIADEIRKWFATGNPDSSYVIESLDPEYRAYVVLWPDEFGVAMKYSGSVVNEDFAHAKMYSRYMNIAEELDNYLFLVSDYKPARNEFAAICENFVEPGRDGEVRIAILRNPSEWWKKWKRIIGNAVHESMPYSVLGEMLILDYFLQKGEKADWTGPEFGLHDLLTSEADYEVKSTLSHHGRKIEIHGEFQLTKNRPLYLAFCRFEENSMEGISINDAVIKLCSDGMEEDVLNSKLGKIGYPLGKSSRNEKYRVVESLLYPVDDIFPCIKPSLFKGDVIPAGISDISYRVDLDILTGKEIRVFGQTK